MFVISEFEIRKFDSLKNLQYACSGSVELGSLSPLRISDSVSFNSLPNSLYLCPKLFCGGFCRHSIVIPTEPPSLHSTFLI